MQQASSDDTNRSLPHDQLVSCPDLTSDPLRRHVYTTDVGQGGRAGIKTTTGNEATHCTNTNWIGHVNRRSQEEGLWAVGSKDLPCVH